MKLASLKSGRDGQLVVVSRDLTRAATAGHIAATLQTALDDWTSTGPKLALLANALESRRCGALFLLRARLRLAFAARLSMGRRLGLCESRSAGEEGARGRDARRVLDRSAHISGGLRFNPRTARSDRVARR